MSDPVAGVGAGVDLYWLPLGAGGRWVRLNGRLYEAGCAALQHRPRAALYHSALRVLLPPDAFAVEMTPAWGLPDVDRGVLATGSVGLAGMQRWRAFRYEVHAWRGGAIGDVGEAVGGARRLTDDADTCRRLLTLLAGVPTPVWGRDGRHAGEMWNSNSVTSWALARAGLDLGSVHPPEGGRAPGWDAGVAVESRDRERNRAAQP